jgi:hypothetical protein
VNDYWPLRGFRRDQPSLAAGRDDPSKSDGRIKQPGRRGSMHRLARHLKCARDRSLVVIIAAHDNREIEPDLQGLPKLGLW